MNDSARIVTEFPRRVRDIEHTMIPLPDGTRLAARIWLPEDAERDPVPALLEYIPYRKRDSTRIRDEPIHRYFAGHGYASVRADLRGSGDSEGVMSDEYTARELDDGVHLVAWLAAQPWCTGKVGIIGNSWGGFNGLQIAALRPPALRCIITSCSTDDRYADDMHMMGGCVLTDNLDWGTTFFAYLHRPPDPALAGDRWREMWRQRVEDASFPLQTWFQHQRRDAYWKHGSVCERYADIECPVFAIGGWFDGYSNAIPRLLANLDAPCLGVIGPWAHKYGHNARPGPAIGFLQEALRWWDHWLKGIDTGIMREPAYRVWMQESLPPEPALRMSRGRWVGEARWPSDNVRPRTWHLNEGTLDEAPGRERALLHRSAQTVGLAGGEWCPYGTGGAGPQLAADQREDDGRSLTFDTPPLAERVEILGAPVLELDLAVDRPRASIAARLNDVSPEGAVTRASYTVLNLTHRDSHEHPEPMPVGRRTRVRLQLNDTAYAFAAGHRIRVSLSTAYWPMVWPSPHPVLLSVYSGASTLELPVRAPRESDSAIAFEPPEAAAPSPTKSLAAPELSRKIIRDVAANRLSIRSIEDEGTTRLEDHGMELGGRVVEQFDIADDDPLSARAERENTVSYRRGEWAVSVRAKTTLSASADAWHLRGELSCQEGGETFHSQVWDLDIPREDA